MENAGGMRRAWIVSFGPVDAGTDGYLNRAETNARALAALGFEVSVLEVSTRTELTLLWPNVRAYPAFPHIVRQRPILGPIALWSNLRAQVALAVGLVRYRSQLRSADAVIVEGGLLALTFLLRLGRRQPSIFVFDLITLMSALHRDPEGHCTFQCKFRRGVWLVLERFCVRFSDVAVAGSAEDAVGLHGAPVEVVPHAVLTEASLADSHEDSKLVAFLGNGGMVPNREAVDFIASAVLNHPRLLSVSCRVIGSEGGYRPDAHARMDFVGFAKDLAEALSPVSICLAPMEGAGGVSTKVLVYLMSGKRTVCTPEAAHGIATPAEGLWIAEKLGFAEAVGAALAHPWSPSQARRLRDWMVAHHGFEALTQAWSTTLASDERTIKTTSPA